MKPASTPAHGRRRRTALVGVCAAAGLLAATHSSGPPRFRFVGVMHDNLAALNSIYEALSRSSYDTIASEARHLASDAEWLEKADLDRFGLDAARDEEFDRHARRQARASREIGAAAEQRDASAVLAAVERLTVDACMGCHADFREEQTLRTPPVLFMRSLLRSVETINRGMATNDFALIAREAREIGAVAHVFRWTQVIEMMFGVSEPGELTRFQAYLDQLSSQAARVEGTAVQRDGEKIAASVRELMEKGCVGCHAEFYPEDGKAGRASRAGGGGPAP